MNKLTLDDLRRQYSDRPQPAEVEKLAPAPVVVEPTVPDVVAITPEVTQARMSTTPLVGFLVFAGIAMFAGFAVLVNIELKDNEPTQNVLGAADIQTALEERTQATENVAPEDMDIAPVVEDIYNLMVGEESQNEEDESVVVEDTSTSSVTEEDVVVEEIADDMTTDLVAEAVLVRVLDVTGGYVNLRRVPGSSTGAFSRAASGTEFELVSELEIDGYTWVEVKYDESTTCWIRGDLVEKL